MSIRSTSIFKDLSPLHDKYVIFSTDKAHTNNVCVCKSHYIDYLMKESRYWKFTCQPHIYPDDTYERGNPGQSGLLSVPLEFQPKMKNGIYHHSTGFLNNTTLHSSSLLYRVCKMLHETSFHIINMYSIGSQNRTSELLCQ